MDLKHFTLRVKRKFSRITNRDIFSKIYRGNLKGYRFIVITPYDDYFTTEYEQDSFSYVINEIKQKPESVIFDLGANLGYFSLLCASYSSGAKIFAFEPIPANMTILCRHLLINNVKNVTPVNLAVSDHLGLVDFSADNQSVSYTYKQSSSYYGIRHLNIKIGTTSLDTLNSQFGFPEPDIIKIDVEGAEYDVLLGAESLIKKCKPKILLSTHKVHVEGVEEKCLLFLDRLNYSYIKFKNDAGRMEGLNDFWCTPK